MSLPSQHRLAFAGVGLLCAVPLATFVYSAITQKPFPERGVSKLEPNNSEVVESSNRPPRATLPPTQSAAARPRRLGEVEASNSSTEATADIEELRSLALTNPVKSLKLARSALDRSPSGLTVAELRWHEARALVSLGQFADARDVAAWMVEHHPESPFTADARRHLLSHPFGLPPR